ncbi:MAG: hypothetical protein FWG41_05915 [Methanomassiliicoccaceae archaeon]|nr:hypothetical protein [Methanomassiliicoccaceae archaeon]
MAMFVPLSVAAGSTLTDMNGNDSRGSPLRSAAAVAKDNNTIIFYKKGGIKK